jgi:hypothetical protein
MMSLMRDTVKDHICELKDGEYSFPSGTNKTNFDVDAKEDFQLGKKFRSIMWL